MEINYLAVVVATVAAFVGSSVWYGLLGSQLARLNDAYADSARAPVWIMLVEFVRSLVVAYVLVVLAGLVGVAGLGGAVQLGVGLWIGFPVVLLVGSVIHENVPWKLAAIHAGDWLVKLIVIAVVVGVWR
jgi:hypothetical protein